MPGRNRSTAGVAALSGVLALPGRNELKAELCRNKRHRVRGGQDPCHLHGMVLATARGWVAAGLRPTERSALLGGDSIQTITAGGTVTLQERSTSSSLLSLEKRSIWGQLLVIFQYLKWAYKKRGRATFYTCR